MLAKEDKGLRLKQATSNGFAALHSISWKGEWIIDLLCMENIWIPVDFLNIGFG